MPKIRVEGYDSEGWRPLPNGTYMFMIDGYEEAVSSNQNPQLKVNVHVVDGEFDGKKATLWYVLMAKTLWKIRGLCDATGIEYESENTGRQDPETGKDLITLDFEADDLVGCVFVADVTEGEYQGNAKNNFNNERPVEGSEAAAKLDARRAAEEAEEEEEGEEEDEGDEEEEEAEEEEAAAPPAAASSKKGAAQSTQTRSRRRAQGVR